MIVKLDEVVNRITGNEDRFTTDLKYYIGGEHYEYENPLIANRGLIKSEKGSLLGFKFHFPFKKGDVLFMARNPHLKKAGMVSFDGICSDASYILRTKDDKVLLQEFLPFVIQNEKMWQFFEANKSGSVNYLMNWKELKNYEFDLPTIEEQEQLSQTLWQIVMTMESYKKLIKKTDEMVIAKFVEIFGDPNTNNKKWEIKKLPEISQYHIGLTYKPDNVVENGTLVLRSGNIQNSILSFNDNVYVNCKVNKELFVQENDILMCSRNGSSNLVGKVAKIPKLDKPTTYGAFMTIIRSKYWNYLYYYFQQNCFRNQIGGTKTTTVNQITQSMLDKIELPLPPVELQTEFLQLTNKIEQSKVEIQASLDSLKQVYKKIITENLGGSN